MDFEITLEDFMEVTKRYGLKTEKSDKPGFYIDGTKMNANQLYEYLFGDYSHKEVQDNVFLKDIKAKKGHTEFVFKNLNNSFESPGNGAA